MQTPVQTFNRATLILLGLGLAVWLGWRLAYPTYAWHHKITITVETPSGDVSGSSVSAVTIWTGPKLLPDAPDIGFEVVAEAPVVEIAPGRYLFALIEGAAGWAQETYAPTKVGQPFETQMRETIRQKGKPPVVMPRAAWPRFVTFGDLADPTTVRLVDPDDLAEAFGPGVRLKSVTLELTREAVTQGRVEAVLGWLPSVWPRMLDGQRYETINSTNRIANTIGVGSFSTEIGK